VFRTQKRQVGALDAQCCHIGADLSKGQVDGDCLRCPLHQWAFDAGGICRDIPCQDEIPHRARQTALRCSEHYGLVYACLGQEEDFSLPRCPGMGKVIVSKPRIIDFDSCYEMASANSFDEQHLATVHRRTVINGQTVSSISPFHFAIEYKAKVSPHTLYDKFLCMIGKEEVHMKLDCWGGNLLLFSHLGTSNRMVISLLPIDETHTRAFISTVLERNRNSWLLPLDWLSVSLLNWFTMMFVKQDVRALQGMDFRFINVLPEADSTMIKWYKYWKKLPRTNMGGNDLCTTPDENGTSA